MILGQFKMLNTYSFMFLLSISNISIAALWEEGPVLYMCMCVFVEYRTNIIIKVIVNFCNVYYSYGFSYLLKLKQTLLC